MPTLRSGSAAFWEGDDLDGFGVAETCAHNSRER